MSKVYTDNVEKRTGGSAIAVPASGQWIDLASAAQGDVLYHNGTSYVRLAAGTSGHVFTSGGAGANPSWAAAPPEVKRAAICQQEASGVAAGTATSGSWEIRTLNTEIYDDIGISLATNVFTLPAGTFFITWSAPARQVNSHMTRLYDVTNTAVVEYGTSGYDASGAYDTHDRSWGYAKVTPSVSTGYRIEHQVYTTVASWGYGYPASFSVEKYTTVEIEQHA